MKKRITQDTQINPLCHPRNPLFYKTNNSLFHTAANDIQQLIGDALLAGLVVLYRQFLNQIFRIVCSEVTESSNIVYIFWHSTIGNNSDKTFPTEGSTI